MNITDLIQSYFDGDNAARLGQAAGIDAKQAQNALATGLPLQLRALAEHAAHPEGQNQVLEAVSSLPNFGTIAEVLGSSDGASNLQRAGELLAPALLGGKADSILSSVTGQVGASSNGNGIQKILHMALPLVLSLLGRQGLSAGNITSVLSSLSGGQAGVTNAATGTVPAVAGATAGLGAAGLATAAAKAGSADNGLLELLKAQFSGANADKIGAAAGFTGNASGRAVQGALPVVLNALVNKGKTEAGANDLLKMAAPFAGLSNSDGHLNTGLLGDSAELARVEGQGRGLLGGLFGNVDEIAGRLGTGLGGSGSNASRLLALVAPMVLSLLGKRAGSASVLSSLLGGISASHLSGLLPAGLTGLGALLGAGTAAATPVRTPVTAPATETVVAKAKPAKVVTETPRPVTPPPTPTVTTTEKRGGIPWWLWLIPLILLALLFTLCNKKPAPVAAAPGCALIVENPSSDSKLPVEGFTMSGKAPANSTVKIMDQGQAVATATADANCAWTAPIPAPTAGEHTFSVEDGDAKSEFKANFAADAAAASGAAATTPAATTPASEGTFAITNPAAAATLPAGGFDLKGTGKAGDEVEVFQDGTSLGKTTIGSDGTWAKSVPSPTTGAHTYSVKGPDGAELGNVATTVGAAAANASATNCTKDYTLKSITDGQKVSEPFLFGGEGKGKGYTVTVKRGARTIGTKDIALDSSCGWSYNSKPGKGQVSYEVRPMGDASAAALSTINLTVTN